MQMHFTGKDGFKGLKDISRRTYLSRVNTKTKKKMKKNLKKLNLKMKFLFACTGTIGETFPTEKIKQEYSRFNKKN